MLLSACIIAKDERERVSACIASLAGAVDEVVVYDTGSSDGTMELAGAAGAVVIAGRWPGGFAEARNAALEHCRGEWVLSIDADEELVCADRCGLRRRLRRAPASVLALQVPIDNLTGVGLGSGYSHVADRLFRREACRWRGRLHEQLLAVSGSGFPPVQPVEHARLRHHGYLHDVEHSRLKADRNLALARAEVEDPSFGDRGIARVWLGRALWAADRPEEALGHLLEGARDTANPVSRRQGIEAAARIALRLGRMDTAQSAISELRRASLRPVVADILDAGIQLARGHHRQALELMEASGATSGEVPDDDGRDHGPAEVLEWQAAALLGCGRADRAADLVLGSWDRSGRLDADLDLLVECLEEAGQPLTAIAGAVAASALPTMVAAGLRLAPHRGHLLLDALWQRFGQSGDQAVAVLAGASVLGRLLEPELAAVWSERLRERGLGELCPLRAVAVDASVPPDRRRDAAGELHRRFSEDVPGRDFAADLASDAGRGPETQVTWKTRPTGTPAFSVVLLARGGAESVLACLQSLSSTLPDTRSFEVIAVDTGSTDATAALLASLEGEVAVVRTETPMGAARARNLGASVASAPVLVFVESSARPGAGWIEALLDAFDSDQSLGAVGPVLVDSDGEVRCAGASVRIGIPPPPPGSGLAHRPWGVVPEATVVEWLCLETGGGTTSAPRTAEVDALASPVVAVRRADLERAGGFDPGYWDGGETIDLCFALRDGGSKVACQYSSVVAVAGDSAGKWAWSDGDPHTDVMTSAGRRWQHRDNQDRFVRRRTSGAPELTGLGPVVGESRKS